MIYKFGGKENDEQKKSNSNHDFCNTGISNIITERHLAQMDVIL